MTGAKTVGNPDERRAFPRDRLEAVHFTGLGLAAGTFEPR